MRGRSVGRYLASAILVFGAVVITCLVIGSSQTFHHCIDYAKGREPYNNTFPSIPGIGHSFQRDRLLIACGSHFLDVHNGLVTAVATAVVAVFTFSLWVATRGLYDAGERQIGLIKQNAETQGKLTEESLRIAGVNAAAAERAADTARDTLIASYRPWVKINELQFHGRLFVSPENRIQARVTVNFENIGNAPAECYISSWLIPEKEINRVITEHVAYAEHHRNSLRGVPFVVYPKDVFPPIGDCDFLYFTTIAEFGIGMATAIIDSGNFQHLYVGACITYRVAGSAVRPHQTRILKGLLAFTSLRSTETDKWDFHIRHRFDPGGHAAD